MGDIIEYGKTYNILKMRSDEPDLGEHHRGTVLICRGRLLNAENEWQDVSHRDRHIRAEEENFILPPAFSNFLSTLKDAASVAGEGNTLARITACVRECIGVATGTAGPLSACGTVITPAYAYAQH